MTLSFFTIGHSTRSTAEFIDLLRGSQIELVVDVRHMPRSRTNPQFNREILSDQLHDVQIGYVHLAALGGLRHRPRGIEASPNLFWENASFRHYADYAMTEEFQTGLAELRELGHERRSPSCARKRSGGAVTGGSSPTISFVPARAFSISSIPIASIGRCSRQALSADRTGSLPTPCPRGRRRDRPWRGARKS